MDYSLEVLGDERFQKLCQAILTASFPNVQCFPVGQPDGGRDALERHEGGFTVFQVKYSRSPANKDERIAVSELISSEGSKVEELIRRGATAYYLMTNVSGTSHLDRGSIDIVNSELTKAFGIPSFCWWRDDIERRIDATTGLIWRYPEILKGTDFLEILASGAKTHLSQEKTSTFRAYVLFQYNKESEVRFQQVQLQNSLLDLFTDTPIGLSRDKIPPPDVCNISEYLLSILSRSRQGQHFASHDESSDFLAAGWLLAVAPQKGTQRIILEGAPGQGKSTVTQYLAQIQRMRSLRKDQDTTKVSERHLAYDVRLPLRVDLRDYAAWLLGNDPFAAKKDVPRPLAGIDSLESFLSHQISTLSGGRQFSVSDLANMLNGSRCLLILDGFDEVADQPTRARLIEQIRTASERVGGDCESLQVIVTSRPAAFILAPGFNEREWLHLSLLPMRLKQIEEYTDKWIAARTLSQNEGREFKQLLIHRVERPHIRSLAQNPMQLAILLNLISTKGMSLPDKRTALYDSYMDLFFGREAEKDETVRENRDVLIQIHKYVAWTLQLDAEKPGGSGSISQSELEALVRKFLTEKGHDGDVLKLFSGAVERVGALVSRVQGMLEFEVQPLREYFSGKFLYETAPYSPPGAEKGGTRPQRFDALARRPYWLNVTRFYAGCYNSGELSGLVSGLEQLDEGGSHSLTNHALQLALLFLNDWVFAQEPKTVRDVVDFLTSEKNLRFLIANRVSWEDERLALPEKSGRKELAAKAKASFLKASELSQLNRLGMLLILNLSLSDRWLIWKEVRERGDNAFFHATSLGLFSDISEKEQKELIEVYGDDGRHALIIAGNWDELNPDDRVSAMRMVAKRRPSLTSYRFDGRVITGDPDLFRVYVMLNPYIYSALSFDRKSDQSFEDSMARFGVFNHPRSKQEGTEEIETGLFDVKTSAIRTGRFGVSLWRTSLEPWTDFVESVRRTWGDGNRIYCLAAIAAGIVSKDARAVGFEMLFDEKLPLVERARFARLNSRIAWWQKALGGVTSSDQLLWVLILMLSWAPTTVLKGLGFQLSEIIDQLDVESWGDLISSVRAVVSSTSAGRNPLTTFDEAAWSMIGSPRLKALLTLRLPRATSIRGMSELLDSCDGTDRYLCDFLAFQGINTALREPKIWKNLIAFFRKHRVSPPKEDVGNSWALRRFYYGHPDSMAISTVQDVVGNPDDLPIPVLEIALLNLSRRSTTLLNTLGTVAQIEGWFS